MRSWSPQRLGVTGRLHQQIGGGRRIDGETSPVEGGDHLFPVVRELRGDRRQLVDRVMEGAALATAQFLASQKPNGSAYVIGNSGLINALYEAGYSMNDIDPDYVIVSETPEYNFTRICRAIKLVRGGAKLIGTNPDMTGPVEGGDIVPATGALIAPIELATGAKPYYIGKPNPLMMRNASAKLGVRHDETAIIGDRMDTDMIAGIESDMTTVLVLSGVTSLADIGNFAYRSDYVFDNVGGLLEGASA